MMFSKINFILGKNNRNNFYFFLFINFIYFFLEFLSLASLPIFVSFIVNPDLILEKSNIYLRNFNIIEINFASALLFLPIFTIVIFLLKNIFLVIITYLQNNFLKKIKVNLSEKFFSFYINSPYLYHVNKNPSKLSRNISDEIQGLYIYFFHLSGMFREGLTIFIIFIFLVFVNFYVTFFIVLFFFSSSFLYIRLIKPFLKKKAIENQNMRQLITQIIYESFGSIKDLKILNKENQIISFFNKNINIYEKNLLYFTYFDKLPRIFLELFSVIIVCLICIFYLNLGQDYKVLIPTLSLLAISFMRFAPAFSSVTTSFYYMKLFEPTINLIFSELKNIENTNINNLRNSNEELGKISNNLGKNFIFLNNITFAYPDSKLVPIKNITMNIEKGSIVGITGQSGAGKSTLFHLMLGLLTPQQGNIFYNGKDIFTDISAWRKEVGYISQNIYLLDGSIKKNITFNFSNENIDDLKLNYSIKVSGLEDRINKLKNGLDSEVGVDGLKFSGGEKQRIAIARAIYQNPNILFMDESTSALDDQTEEFIISNLLNAFKDKTIIIIAHRQSTINHCNVVWNLKNGVLSNQ
jgi:ABC-type bacteriocin/lantibiotic exporter with double-glycine peptidase domain